MSNCSQVQRRKAQLLREREQLEAERARWSSKLSYLEETVLAGAGKSFGMFTLEVTDNAVVVTSRMNSKPAGLLAAAVGGAEKQPRGGRSRDWDPGAWGEISFGVIPLIKFPPFWILWISIGVTFLKIPFPFRSSLNLVDSLFSSPHSNLFAWSHQPALICLMWTAHKSDILQRFSASWAYSRLSCYTVKSGPLSRIIKFLQTW